MSRNFAVIGMGWLGCVLAENLRSLGHQVLGIDSDEGRVEELSARLPEVRLVTADAQQRSTLESLGVGDFDGAAVTIVGDIQASVLTTITLKNLGVPLVVARAANPLHAQILEHVGADRVTRPSREAGENMARLMVSRTLRKYMDLGGDEALAEAQVPCEWTGKSLSELRLPDEHGLTVLLIRHGGETGAIPGGDTTLRAGDTVVVWGSKERLDRSNILRGG